MSSVYRRYTKKKQPSQSYHSTIPAGLQPPVMKQFQYPVQTQTTALMQTNYSNMPYYMTQALNTSNISSKTMDTQTNSNTQQYYQRTSSTFQAQNQWVYPINMPYPKKDEDTSTQGVPKISENYQNDRDKRGDRKGDARKNWRDNKSPPSKGHDSFGNFGQRESRSDDQRFETSQCADFSRYRRDDDRSPPRGRNRDRSWENQRDSYDRSRCSRSNRSNPRDDYCERRSDRQHDDAFDHRERQRKRDIDQHGRTNYHERQPVQVDRDTRDNTFRQKRSFETSITFSSNPENSTFTKSNSNIFGASATTHSLGGETSKTNAQFNNPNQASKSNDDFPPAKRSRFEQNFPTESRIPNERFAFPSNIAKAEMNKKIVRHMNWRNQSAALLSKEILRNSSKKKLEKPFKKNVLKKLKEFVTFRLDEMMGDNIATSLPTIMHSYRTRFNDYDDFSLFKAVLESVERETGGNADEVKEVNEDSEIGPTAQQTVPKQNQECSTVTIQQNPRLHPYPNDQKKEFKKMKKMEVLEQQVDFYKMDATLQNAVDVEVDKLVECYIEACRPSDDEIEEAVGNKIINTTVDNFRQVIKLHITKRVLNITTGLAVRIFSSPKHPPKHLLDAFLQSHGAISLKKSDKSKMYIAHCDSYESYDRLLAVRSKTIGDVTIIIKPLHISGPPQSHIKRDKQTGKLNKEEEFAEDICEEDLNQDVDEIEEKDFALEVSDESEEKDSIIQDVKGSKEFKSDPDVVLIENNESEVYVIHDESLNLNNKTEIFYENNDEKREMKVLTPPDCNIGENTDSQEMKQSSYFEATLPKTDKQDIKDIKDTIALTDNKDIKDTIALTDKEDENSLDLTHNLNSGNENSEQETKYSTLSDSVADKGNSINEEQKYLSESNDKLCSDDILNAVDEFMEEDLEDF